MKSRLFILTFIFTLTSSLGFAKNAGVDFTTSTEDLRNIGSTTPDRDEKLEAFDFQEVFNRAEKYFKAAKAWKKIKCEPKSGFLCSKHTCKQRDMNIFLVLDKEAGKISRCEKKQCEIYDATFEQSGAFFNVQTNGPIGTLVRILGDSRYKEITTVGLDAYIANGNCEIITD